MSLQFSRKPSVFPVILVLGCLYGSKLHWVSLFIALVYFGGDFFSLTWLTGLCWRRRAVPPGEAPFSTSSFVETVLWYLPGCLEEINLNKYPLSGYPAFKLTLIYWIVLLCSVIILHGDTIIYERYRIWWNYLWMI